MILGEQYLACRQGRAVCICKPLRPRDRVLLFGLWMKADVALKTMIHTISRQASIPAVALRQQNGVLRLRWWKGQQTKGQLHSRAAADFPVKVLGLRLVLDTESASGLRLETDVIRMVTPYDNPEDFITT